MEPHQVQTVSCHQLVQPKTFVPPLPRFLQNWWCCIVPVSWGKILSSQYHGCLSPANVTTEVKCVEMHHEALSEATPEGAVHQNVYSGNCWQWQWGGGDELWLEAAVLHCSTAHDHPEPSRPNHCRLCPLLDSNTPHCLQVCWGKTTHQHSEQSWKTVLGSRKLVPWPSVRSPAILCVKTLL